MQLKKVKIEDIKPYPNNPRKNDMAVEAVMESIKQCEYVSPIVLDENKVILCGHTRWRALKELGYSEVECVIKEGLTDEQKRKYRILDNKTAEIAEWDYELLEIEMAGLDFGNLELDFDFEFEKEAPETVEDEIPELDEKKESRCKPGDIWQCGRHRLMCADSTKASTVELLMAGAKANLVITDPPYNVNYEGNAGKIKNDNMENEAFYTFLLSAFQNTEAAMAKDASIYVFHADTEGLNFRRAFSEAGFYLSGTCIWKKQSLVLGRSPYQWQHEPCLFGWKKSGKHQWYTGRKETTIWEFDRPTASLEHPTMKPVALFAYLLRNSSKGGDIVLDVFGGSGTTMIAAEQNGRTAYLMEIDPHYCDVILTRWENLTGERAERL